MGKFIKHLKVQITSVKDIGGQLLVNYDFQSVDIMNGSVRDDRSIWIGIAFPYIGKTEMQFYALT